MKTIAGRTKAQWARFRADNFERACGFPSLNADIQRQFQIWRETELPKLRAQRIASGFIRRVDIEDNIVSVEELKADPHAVWQEGYSGGGWRRVEIEG
jgi:hypothetical protein